MMEIMNLISVENIWTLPVIALVAWLMGTILRDLRGWNPKVVGLITALVLSLLSIISQLAPQTSSILSAVTYTLVIGVLGYALAYMTSDVVAKARELLGRQTDTSQETVMTTDRGVEVAGFPTPEKWSGW